MKRVIIIHGWEATPESNWYQWLKDELVKRGFEVEVPCMPNTNYPQLNEWLSKIRELAKESAEDLILIGHSLGTPAILQYLASLDGNQKIKGAIFVAGLPAFGEVAEIKNFYADIDIINEAKKHCHKFALIYSDNDKYVSKNDAENFADKIEARKIFEPAKGHFMKSEGVTTLPSALEALLRMSSLKPKT